MNLEQCTYCGEAFTASSSKVCAKCAKELDGYFARIRKFLYTTPTEVTSTDIIRELEIPEKAVVHLIESGRLMSEKKLVYKTTCKVCGKEMKSGALVCPSCSRTLNESLGGFAVQQRKREEDRAAELKERKKVQPIHNR